MTCAPHTRPFVALGLSLLALLTFGLWTFAHHVPLDSAIVARGQIRGGQEVQVLQHQTGGVVAQIFVTDGDQVTAGQPLIQLQSRAVETDLNALRAQYLDLTLEQARLRAEGGRSTADLSLPNWVQVEIQKRPAAAQALAQQRARLSETRALKKLQRDLLSQEERQRQLRRAALTKGLTTLHGEAHSAQQEVARQEQLVSRALARQDEVQHAQRNTAHLARQITEAEAEIALIDSETPRARTAFDAEQSALRLAALDAAAALTPKLTALQARIAQRQRDYEDLTLRAPISGRVFASQLSGPGTVVRGAQPLLSIAPHWQLDRVNAKIAPRDIEALSLGQTARISFPTLPVKPSQPVLGHVIVLSPDLITGTPQEAAHYLAVIQLETPAQLASLNLRPGLPVEVQLTTGQRTLLSYLAEPLNGFWQRAFRN